MQARVSGCSSACDACVRVHGCAHATARARVSVRGACGGGDDGGARARAVRMNRHLDESVAQGTDGDQ